MTNPAAGGPAGHAELDAHGIDTGHRRRDSDLRSVALAVRLRPPVTIPGTSDRRAPGTQVPAKEGSK